MKHGTLLFTLIDLLIVERRSRSKLETAVAQELLALRQEIAKCQCGKGNGGHTQTLIKTALTNDTKALEEEIIQLKRDQALLHTQVAILLEGNLTILQNRQCDLDVPNQTNHLEKELQITDNKRNAVINDANARKQDFIALLQRFTGLNQNHTTLKNNFMQLERNLTMENTKCRNETSQLEKALQITNNKLNAANSRNQSIIVLSEKVAGLIQNSTVLKDNVKQSEQNFTMNNTKCCLNFRNETSHVSKALQITNNKLNAVTNDAIARKQDFIALFQKVQSTEQRVENSTRSLEASQNITFLKLQTEITNGGKSKILCKDTKQKYLVCC